MHLRIHGLLAATICTAAWTHADDWTRFRGPNGSGVADLPGAPVTWSAQSNLAWKIELPGPGSSSPVVFGQQIFVTCYTGYGAEKGNPGTQADLTFHVMAVNAGDGSLAWDKTLKAKTPVSDYKGYTARHGYASSTPAVDADAVYTLFGHTGVQAWSHDGRPLWTHDIGAGTYGWGVGTSPILAGGLLIVDAFVEGKALIALNRKTGEEVWRQGGVDMSWNTPIVIEAGGRQELVLSTKGWIKAFDPAKGTPLWMCKGIEDYVCPSCVSHDGVVYAIGGRKNAALAVRGGGANDVTATRQVWRIEKGSNVSSPVYWEGHLYWANESHGVVYCVDAVNGTLVYEQALVPPSKEIYASPLVADGRLYYVSRHNGTYVLPAKPEFQVLAHNVIADDSSVFNASPAPLPPGRLLLRSDQALYGIGSK